MHRLTRALRIKKIFSKSKNNEVRDFSVHCFSMMLNCIDLSSISEIFRSLCICLTRDFCDNEVYDARDNLINLIKNKSDILDKSKLDSNLENDIETDLNSDTDDIEKNNLSL